MNSKLKEMLYTQLLHDLFECGEMELWVMSRNSVVLFYIGCFSFETLVYSVNKNGLTCYCQKLKIVKT